MAWDFKPGMKIVCVDKAPPNYPGEPLYGDVGTITNVYVTAAGDLALELLEFPQPGVRGEFYAGWLADGFRPVRTTDISSLEAHLNTLPVRTKTEA